MGFNTVAMLLNDHMHELEKSPHALTFAITHPPHSFDERHMRAWFEEIRSVAEDHGERIPVVSHRYGGGLTVLPTFHADDIHYLYAGRNSLERMEPLHFGIAKRKKYGEKESKEINTVTLALPDWWRKDG